MRAFVTILVLLASSASVAARPTEIGVEGFSRTLWEAKDGLPDQTVQAFAQTHDGNLWIGTKGGLVRFDGARFTSYDRDVAPASLARGVNYLLTSKDGSLWIGTEGGGLIRFWDGEFRVYPTEGGLSNEFIRAIFEDRSGTLWIGADQGLFQVSGLTIKKIDNSHGTPAIFVRAIVQDGQGHVWVGGTTLLEFSGNLFLREYPLPGGPSLNLITSMYSAPHGTPWVGTLSGLHQLTPSGELSDLPGISAWVSVIRQTVDGRLWAGTIGQGLFYLQNDRLFHISSDNLPSKTVNDVFEDQEGNLWLGTQAGVVRLSRTPASIVPFPGGADSVFETLSDDGRGTIWVAASQVFRIRDGTATPYSIPRLPGLRVRTLEPDGRGGLWVGTDGAGLLHVDGNHVERFNIEHDLVNNFVRAILLSRDGSIWVGTDGGVTHLEGEHSQNYDVDNGLAYFSVTALFQDRGGDIWVSTSRGLSHIVHGRIVHDLVTRELSHEQLWSIAQDASGELWFGTSNGLYGYRVNRLIHLTTAQGLVSNTIYEILDDSRGSIWLGSPNCISRVPVGELDNFQTGTRVALTFYEDSADLDSAALYSGLQPEGAVSPNGDVWFPTNKGAVHIAVNRILPAASSSIRIEDIIAAGQDVPLKGKVVLKPGNARLEISYAVIHLGSQEGFRYRYEMGGLESWNEVFTRRTAYYTHLPPGKYRFRVQAYDIGNPGAVSEASILIVQEPHFYATYWFFACCVITSLSLVFLVYRFRLRQMKLRFHMVNEERARLAREMHDTVIQGCVGVSSLVEAALEVESSETRLRDQLLNYASDQVRATIESAREAVWALRNTSTSAADVATLCEELSRQVQSNSGVPVRCRVTGDSFKFGESSTHELLMTVREALANAVTHANPQSIDIDVCFTKRSLEIEVRDDGCGFDQSPDSSRNGHFGMLGMQERVRLLRGSLTIDSKPNRGTRVRIVVPRRRHIHIFDRVWAGNEGERDSKD